MSGTSGGASGFTKKQMSVTISRSSGTFTGTQSNTVSLTGLRVWFSMIQAGGVTKDRAKLVIFGLPPSLMNDLSTYGRPPDLAYANNATIRAGDANGMSQVFAGTIVNAWQNNNAQPEVRMEIELFQSGFAGVAPVNDTSFAGKTNASTIMQNIAALWQPSALQLENNGVTVQLDNPHYTGSAYEQAQMCARDGNFYMVVDSARNVLAIVPRNGMRGGQVPLISPGTGLVGYPKVTFTGVEFECIWNPNLIFNGQVKVQSSQSNASGTYVISQIATSLQTETPGGDWFQRVVAWNPPS